MPLVSAAQRGVETGLATGGRLSGLGTVFKGIADRLRQTRETEEAVGVLGRTERVKQQVKQEFAPPAEYKPTTREEALEFEKAKIGLNPTTQSIVGPTGEVIGERPKGAVFAPRGDAFERQIIGGIRQMKSEGDSLEEIRDFINFSGANPEDYADEIGAYRPAPPKKSFLKGLFQKTIGSPIFPAPDILNR